MIATRTIILLLLLIASSNLSAQLDNNKKSTEKGKKKLLLSTNAKKVTKPKSLKGDSKDGFKNAYDQQKKKQDQKRKENQLTNKGILSSAKIAEDRFLQSFNQINGRYQFPKVDQDLGSFRTQSKMVKIICRDFQYPDGDRVTIMVDGIPMISNITLRRAYQGFDIPLQVGVNKISFIALNQGTSGPNTAAFKVYDDQGYVISSNEWNLATGAKATILIAKDK